MSVRNRQIVHDDDVPVGRVLTRREALVLLGGASAGGVLLLAGCGGSGRLSGAETKAMSAELDCAAKPELTQGPYFVDERLNRADIRSDAVTGAVREGARLELTFKVSRIASGACTSLAAALVDVWQCDAGGVYSDVRDPGFDTSGQTWLRGYQVTDAAGLARFTTILPGWYPGRATHIHFKIRGTNAPGSGYDFTSQLFFPEDFLATAYAKPPYSSRNDRERRRNASDGIYNRGGSQLLLAPTTADNGYAANFNIGLYL